MGRRRQLACGGRPPRTDADGNAVRGELETLDATSNIVVGADGRLTALIGVSDLIVVHTETATLIVPKDRAEEVKSLVARMRADPGRSDLV